MMKKLNTYLKPEKPAGSKNNLSGMGNPNPSVISSTHNSTIRLILTLTVNTFGVKKRFKWNALQLFKSIEYIIVVSHSPDHSCATYSSMSFEKKRFLLTTQSLVQQLSTQNYKLQPKFSPLHFSLKTTIQCYFWNVCIVIWFIR